MSFFGIVLLVIGVLAGYRLFTIEGNRSTMLGSAFLLLLAFYGTIGGVGLIAWPLF